MKITKKFTPITITLEYEEDVSLLVEILRRAKQDYLSSGSPFTTAKKYSDPFVQQCDLLERKLNG